MKKIINNILNIASNISNTLDYIFTRDRTLSILYKIFYGLIILWVVIVVINFIMLLY